MESKLQKTLVIIKPDGVQRGLIGEVISRIERRGLKIIGIKMLEVDETLASRHYEEHVGKPFYEPLVKFSLRPPDYSLAKRYCSCS